MSYHDAILPFDPKVAHYTSKENETIGSSFQIWYKKNENSRSRVMIIDLGLASLFVL